MLRHFNFISNTIHSTNAMFLFPLWCESADVWKSCLFDRWICSAKLRGLKGMKWPKRYVDGINGWNTNSKKAITANFANFLVWCIKRRLCEEMQKVGELTSLNVRQQGNKVPSLPCHYFKHSAEYMYFAGKYMVILMFCILAIVIRFA